jgi:hypothetical protein
MIKFFNRKDRDQEEKSSYSSDLVSGIKEIRKNASKGSEARIDFAEKLANGEWNLDAYRHNYRIRQGSYGVSLIAFTYCAYQIGAYDFLDSSAAIVNGLVPLIMVSVMAGLVMFGLSFRCYQMRVYHTLSMAEFFDAISASPSEALPLQLPTPPNKNNKEHTNA